MSKKTSTQRRRDDPVYAFYNTKEWKAFRARFLARNRHKGCALCGRPFRQRDHVHVDHYPYPIRTHWHLRLNEMNVRCLHAGCHTDHTQRPGTKARTNADGYPPDWQ